MTDWLQARLCRDMGTLINVMQDGNVTFRGGGFYTLTLCPEHLLLCKLHWPPLDFWVQFKMLVIIYKTWISKKLLTTQLSNIFQQKCAIITFVAITLWNSSPPKIRMVPSRPRIDIYYLLITFLCCFCYSLDYFSLGSLWDSMVLTVLYAKSPVGWPIKLNKCVL